MIDKIDKNKSDNENPLLSVLIRNVSYSSSHRRNGILFPQRILLSKSPRKVWEMSYGLIVSKGKIPLYNS